MGAPAVDMREARRYSTLTIDVARGDLPPIAATLNNVLKRDTPGGCYPPGRFRFRAEPFAAIAAASDLGAPTAQNPALGGATPCLEGGRHRYVARL